MFWPFLLLWGLLNWPLALWLLPLWLLEFSLYPIRNPVSKIRARAPGGVRRAFRPGQARITDRPHGFDL